MKKSERQMVFNKYGGKCAYCGCDLEKGWHVDHVKSIRRNYKRVGGFYRHKETKEVIKRLPDNWMETIEWVPEKTVSDGCRHPELDVIENMIPACASCNINKHRYTIEEFRESIAGYLRSLNLRMVQYKMVKKYGLVEETNKPVVFYFEQFNQQ